MLAIPVAYRRGAHLGMDMLLRLLPARVQSAVGLLTEALWLILALALGRYTLVIMQVARTQESPGLGLPMHWVYSGMVIGSDGVAHPVWMDNRNPIYSFDTTPGGDPRVPIPVGFGADIYTANIKI